MRLWRLLIIILALAGFSLIANGVWIKAKAELAQVLLDRAFTKTLAGERNVRPWPWADISPVARISSKRLNSVSVVLGETSGEALALGPAHLKTTPMPGEEGTSIIAAHRDTHFSWLQNLTIGDDIEVTNTDGKETTFRVHGTRIARYDEANIDVEGFGKKLALTTCYPFESKIQGSMRYIVEAELIE